MIQRSIEMLAQMMNFQPDMAAKITICIVDMTNSFLQCSLLLHVLRSRFAVKFNNCIIKQ